MMVRVNLIVEREMVQKIAKHGVTEKDISDGIINQVKAEAKLLGLVSSLNSSLVNNDPLGVVFDPLKTKRDSIDDLDDDESTPRDGLSTKRDSSSDSIEDKHLTPRESSATNPKQSSPERNMRSAEQIAESSFFYQNRLDIEQEDAKGIVDRFAETKRIFGEKEKKIETVPELDPSKRGSGFDPKKRGFGSFESIPEVDKNQLYEMLDVTNGDVRYTILSHFFILSISDGTYDSRARALLKSLAKTLQIPIQDVVKIELTISQQLSIENEVTEKIVHNENVSETRNIKDAKNRWLYAGLVTVAGY
jgi:hypothetical protein